MQIVLETVFGLLLAVSGIVLVAGKLEHISLDAPSNRRYLVDSLYVVFPTSPSPSDCSTRRTTLRPSASFLTVATRQTLPRCHPQGLLRRRPHRPHHPPSTKVRSRRHPTLCEGVYFCLCTYCTPQFLEPDFALVVGDMDETPVSRLVALSEVEGVALCLFHTVAFIAGFFLLKVWFDPGRRLADHGTIGEPKSDVRRPKDHQAARALRAQCLYRMSLAPRSTAAKTHARGMC